MKSHVIREELSRLKTMLSEYSLSDIERGDIMRRITNLEIMEATAMLAETTAGKALHFLSGEGGDVDLNNKPNTTRPSGFTPSMNK